MSISDIETAVKIVSGVVSAVSGGLSISNWVSRNSKPSIEEQLHIDLAAIRDASFEGWYEVDVFEPEFGPGYMIYVYHYELDELDRIELRERGPWRAEGVDRLYKVLGIDLRDA